MWIVRNIKNEVILVEEFWSNILPKLHQWPRTINVAFQEVTFDDGSKIKKVYGNLYVAFTRTGQQVGLHIADIANDVNDAITLDMCIMSSSMNDSLTIEKIVFTDGSCAIWEEFESDKE